MLWEIHGQAGDDVEELAGEVFCDGFYVGVDDGLFASSALDVLEVVGIVHQLFVLNAMCTNLVLILKNDIFAKLNRMKMVVVSSREFRANQRKYFDLALTNDVVITSRSHGSYRLVPVRESDTLIDQTTLEAKIRRGIEEYEQGKVHKMEEGESVDGFLSRMINED